MHPSLIRPGADDVMRLPNSSGWHLCMAAHMAAVISPLSVQVGVAAYLLVIVVLGSHGLLVLWWGGFTISGALNDN